MATKRSSIGTQTEECGGCGRSTPHEVRIEIRTESGKAENSQFSREPYRVSVCRYCEERTVQRMNNA